jgi:hypothetical protein
VRRAALAAVLGVVLAASALDLALGLLWMTALLGLLAVRRRLRAAPWLVVLACAAGLLAGIHRGWLTPPTPVSYQTGWLPVGMPSDRATRRERSTEVAEGSRLSMRLAALVRSETRLTGAELQRRAAAVLAFARRVRPLRGQAPREVDAVEGVARRLARTLAAPEFRDLDARRARAAEYLAELQRRIAAARDDTDLVGVRQALDPAAMAGVSLRAVREDLAAAEDAMGALLRALGGGVPAVVGRLTVWVDDVAGTVRRELRYLVSAEPPTRLLRIDAGMLRSPPETSGDRQVILDERPPRPLAAGGWIDAEEARWVRIVVDSTEMVESRPLPGPLRRLPFRRVAVKKARGGDELWIVVGLDGAPRLEVPLVVTLPDPTLERLLVPRHALHLVTEPGSVAGEGAWDTWTPADPRVGDLDVELAPPLALFRTRALAAARPYLYRRNLGAAVSGVGLAALTLLLASRPPSAG